MKNLARTLWLAARFGTVTAVIALCGGLPLAADATQYCSDASLLPIVNRPSDAWSPCVVGDDGVLLESGYYQNASSVGGSAIAEYPDAELRVGFARALEVMLDPETQIDRSGNHGKGFFTTSDPGLGLKWQLADQPNGAYDFGAEVNPPETAASFPWQPKYRFGLDSSERVTKRWRTDLGLNLVDDGRIDDGRLDDGRDVAALARSTPALRSTAGLGLAASDDSLFSVELSDQSSVARSLRGQSFGHLAWRQALSRRILVDVEGGQTFNTSAHTRPHYIGAGLSLGSSR